MNSDTGGLGSGPFDHAALGRPGKLVEQFAVHFERQPLQRL